jgi:hypothetical protein
MTIARQIEALRKQAQEELMSAIQANAGYDTIDYWTIVQGQLYTALVAMRCIERERLSRQELDPVVTDRLEKLAEGARL